MTATPPRLGTGTKLSYAVGNVGLQMLVAAMSFLLMIFYTDVALVPPAIAGAALLVGKFITQDLLLRSARLIGVRLTTVQVARFVPLVGQAASAAIGYGAIRFLGQQHIQDCVRVVRQAGLALPPPTD